MSARARRAATYWYLTRIGALNYLAHRATVVLILAVFIIEGLVHGYLWQAVFAGQSLLAGYSLPQMLTYVTLAWVVRVFFNNHADRELGEQIRSGAIAGQLVLPMHLQLAKLCQLYGRAMARLLTTGLPFAAFMAWCFPVIGPASVGHAALFALTAFASLALFTSINFITGTTAFYTEGYAGICTVKSFLLGLLSGMFIPYALLPESLQRVLDWLPFRGLADLPITLYLGKVGLREGLGLAAFQLGWVVLLFAAGQAYWQHAARHRFVEGG